MANETTPSTHTALEHGRLAARRYYAQLAQITTWLLIGVLALMTFLLTVGLQHPQTNISVFLYASIISLALNLIIHVIAQAFEFQKLSLIRQLESNKDKEKTEQLTKSKKRAKATAKGFRIAQQVVFVISVIAVAGLAISAAQFFFDTAAAAAGAGAAGAR